MANIIKIENFQNLPDLMKGAIILACPIMIHNYGLLYYLAGFEKLRTNYPEFNLQFAIPCEQNVGLALQALSQGVKIIYFDARSQAWPQLSEMAQVYGASLYDQGDLHD